jgi:hypothetical protein
VRHSDQHLQRAQRDAPTGAAQHGQTHQRASSRSASGTAVTSQASNERTVPVRGRIYSGTTTAKFSRFVGKLGTL